MPPDEHSFILDSRDAASARWQLLVAAAITALAAFLRIWQAGESLWIDELHTSWVVNGRLSDVLPRAAMGNQSPLYFWGMWLLVQVTGQSEWTLRLPSLVAGIALPAAVWFLVGQVSNLSKSVTGQVGNLSYAALAAALLVAIDPVCIFYAEEARPYAWVMLLAVVELVLLKRLIERPTIGRRMTLLANSIVLFYLHYTAAIFLGSIVVMLPVLASVTGTAYRTKSLIIDLLAAAALATPGIVQMSDVFERRTNWEAFVDKPTWESLVTKVPFALWALVGGIVVGLSLLVPRVLPGNALARRTASSASPTTSPYVRLWYGVLLGSVLIPLVLSWSIAALDAARIYHIRYLVTLVPLAAAATCVAAAWIPWRIAQVAALGLVIVVGIVRDYGDDGRYLVSRQEEWREAVAYLNNQLATSPVGLVIVDSGLIESPRKSERYAPTSLAEDLQYFSFPLRGCYHVSVSPDIITAAPGALDAGRVAACWDPQSGPLDVWAIIRGDDERVRQRIDDLRNQAPFIVLLNDGSPQLSVVEHHQFGKVHVVQFKCSVTSR